MRRRAFRSSSTGISANPQIPAKLMRGPTCSFDKSPTKKTMKRKTTAKKTTRMMTKAMATPNDHRHCECSCKRLRASSTETTYILSIFHSSPSGPFPTVQSGRRLTMSRLRGRAVRRCVPTQTSLGRFRFASFCCRAKRCCGCKVWEARVDKLRGRLNQIERLRGPFLLD